MTNIDIQWDERGLVPAVVYDHQSHSPLMLAWMNKEALQTTLETGIVHFFSRSKQRLWKKGETSGNTLSLIEIRTDCDSDAIIVRAKAAGPACHKGQRSCFYKEIDPGQSTASLRAEDDGPRGVPAAIIDRLYQVLCDRRDTSDGEISYTKSLLEKGFPKIEAKIQEESGELLEVLAEGDAKKVVHESADLLFHMMVGLCAREIPIEDLWAELSSRFGQSGHDEKKSRKPTTGTSRGH